MVLARPDACAHTLLLSLVLLLTLPCPVSAGPRNAGQGATIARKKANKKSRKKVRRKASQPPYTKRPGVRMPRSVERRVAAMARKFYRRTGHPLLITSGYRTAGEQASLMYDKARQGRWRLLRLYRKTDLALQVYRAYRKSRRRGRKVAVANMAAVIRRQVKQGKYISAHLYHGAVDIRSMGMGRSLRNLFKRMARVIPGVRRVIREKHPPHWHVELSVK